MDADLAKEILLNQVGKLEKAAKMEFTDILFIKGLVFSEGERWKKQRTSLAHSF